MLRAGATSGVDGSPLIVVGLNDGNLERLRDQQPIKAKLNTFVPGMTGNILIFHGATDADLERILRETGRIDERTIQSVDPRNDQEAAIRAQHSHILIATVGLPRSGKTTWARRQAWPVVNPDSIRLALHGQRFAANAEPFVWATAKVMVRSLFLAGHKHVILDATNVSRKRRDEWRSKEWGTYFRNFGDVTIGTCKERAKDDAEILPVIDRMSNEWEPLGSDESHWPS